MIRDTMKRPPKRSFTAHAYCGLRTQQGCLVTRQAGTKVEPLHWRLDLWNHSPSGLEWGYHGSGPAQLALAILADALGDDDAATALYQWFKRDVVSRLAHDQWIIHADLVARWVDQHTEGLDAEKDVVDELDKEIGDLGTIGAVEDLDEGRQGEAKVDVIDNSGQVVYRNLPESYGLYVAAQKIGWMTVKRLDP